MNTFTQKERNLLNTIYSVQNRFSQPYALVGGAAFFVIRMAYKQTHGNAVENIIPYNERTPLNVDVLVHNVRTNRVLNIHGNNYMNKINVTPSNGRMNIKYIQIGERHFPVATKQRLINSETIGINEGKKVNKRQRRVNFYNTNIFNYLFLNSNRPNNNTVERQLARIIAALPPPNQWNNSSPR